MGLESQDKDKSWAEIEPAIFVGNGDSFFLLEQDTWTTWKGMKQGFFFLITFGFREFFLMILMHISWRKRLGRHFVGNMFLFYTIPLVL